MGTQEGERDWVDVANDLLSKCHVNLRLRKLSDCDASAFLTLYESILGEKVPDFIATPCSQEDDIHNVQSVIDSLSLDYLQISLSHITGENIVRGDKESIKNLLEIFDGLLEYLKEEISEESQDGEELNDSLNQDVPDETKEQTGSEPVGEREAEPERASTSSCGDAEGKGSTNELIGLGISARTFTAEQEAPSSGLLEPHPPPLTEPLHSAVALQPPNQSDTPHRPDADPPMSNQPATAAAASEEQTEEAAPVTDQTSVPVSETVRANGHQTPPPLQPPDPAVSENPEPGQQRAETETQTEAEALEPTNGGPRRVLFHTQPDVLFLTLQEETAAITPSPPDTEEEEEGDLNYPPAKLDRRRGKTGRSRSEVQDFEDPLLNRRRRNKKAEEELHHISEKLSHRLEELDQMLKRVLSESGESSDVREEDKLSQLSDGLMESGRQKNTEAEPDSTLQTSSPPSCRPLRSQLGEALAEALGLDDGKQTNLSVSDHTRRKETHVRATQRRHVKSKEKELRRREDEERADVDRARLRAQEAEQQYREAILSDVSQASRSRSSPSRTKSQNRSGRQTSPGRRRHEGHRKTASMTVKENELLPVLLDELPHLQITPHALGRMWEQQMQQVDKLHALSSSRGQRRSKLSTQVEEAQRKHDLLVEIIRKEQDHKKRLRDFKERIQQQKSTQNRLREQRQQIARAKKYHSDYHVQHRARLMRARTKEERMFRQLFEEGLELQKQQLREQRAHAKEKRLENQRRHQDHIKSLENYYKDQFSLLAEKLAQERQDIQVRKRAQEKALLKMKRELRTRMEREIGELQKIIIQNDEDDYFQELEVQRLRNRVHMASFQHNTSYLH